MCVSARHRVRRPVSLQLAHALRHAEADASPGRGMSRRRKAALGILVAVECVVLGLAVGAFLRSEDETSFPTSVPVSSAPPQQSRASVPVSVSLPAVGATMTAALARGGQARAVTP